MAKRWVRRPEGSNWGDFGDDDQIGRLNLLTPARVKRAAQEVHEGESFCLSLPLDYPGANRLVAHRFPPRLRPTKRDGRQARNWVAGELISGATDITNDDVMVIHSQYSTQWDSLAHVGSVFDADGDGVPEAVFYNGYRGASDIEPFPSSDGETTEPTPAGVNALGIENMATTAVQGRGVLIDLYRHFGRERALVGYDALRRVMEADGVSVEEGDMVCFRTGFDELLIEMNRDPDAETLQSSCAVLDGRDPKLLDWITDTGAAVLISDNFAVEAVPPRKTQPPEAFLPLHEHCLFKLGIHLGELWYLSELAEWLAEHGRYRFLLTAPPLRMPGAVGSPVTPVATV